MGMEEPTAEAAVNPRVVYKAEPTAGKPAVQPAVEEIQARIAERIRADSGERSAMTPSEEVFALVPDSQRGDVTALLDAMAADERYPDIKAVTAASGLVYFFSKTHIDAGEAVAKCRVEEIKSMIAENVRADSRETVGLTPVGDLSSILTGTEQDQLAAILGEMEKDERYADIKKVTAPDGAVYFHSDRHMSGYYALVLGRVAAKDHCALIASTVRDESRIYPRPTCVLLFLEKPFDIPARDLKTVVECTLRKPEYEDIKAIVHPATGGVYLYSSQYLKEGAALARMDWLEVGKDANP